MIKRVNVIDRIDFNDDGSFKSVKGHVETVKIEIVPNFNQCFEDRTLKVMFWEQFCDDDKDFYCGG
jgi:hypothetical protein